ncbi:MAG: protein phosphatase CheZ [Gammaproteobacteria bacterium]|nr:protein phosphatase CheZ [Gammaproteobacteria bacterium]MDH5630657.1 protein phosphatase CheZ [Gammaproteobacteria bacterium]
MKLSNDADIKQTITRVKDLLNHLENDQIEDAEKVLEDFSIKDNGDLFSEIGKLTRNLHEALSSFNLDSKITDIAASEIPSAKDRLNYVIERTEEAANQTMDMVENCSRMADTLSSDSQELLVEWQKLYKRELAAGEFRKLCKRIESHFKKSTKTSDDLHKALSDVLLAQSYQDLTGQAIKEVISLVHEVEESMVNIIKVFGDMDKYHEAKGKVVKRKEAEGPIVNKDKRDDVVNGQDEVDDLLSSLGF